MGSLDPGSAPVIPCCKLQYGELIGQGAAGQVLRAKHTEWGEVAVKLLKTGANSVLPKDRQKLLEEAEKLRQVSHKHVVRLYGIVCDRDSCGLVMELVQHKSLAQLLGQLSLPPAIKVKLAYEVALGMNYLHTQTPPIIHRDLKTLNILIGEDLSPKITDFGLAIWRRVTRRYSVQLDQAHRAGTPSHIPPESWEDVNLKPNEKFDVYAYGIMLYELLAEEEPFESVENTEQLAYAVKSGQRPDVDCISDNQPKVLQDLMLKCWSQQSAERPTFSEIKSTLEQVYEGEYKPREMEDRIHVLKQIHEAEKARYPAVSPDQSPQYSTASTVANTSAGHMARRVHAQPASALSAPSGSSSENTMDRNARQFHGQPQSAVSGKSSDESSSEKNTSYIPDSRVVNGRVIPSMLLGPNLPLPSDWPSDLMADTTGKVPPPMYEGGLLSKKGPDFVVADCLNNQTATKPQEQQQVQLNDIIFLPMNVNVGSSSSSSNNSSGHINLTTNDSNPGLLSRNPENSRNPMENSRNHIPVQQAGIPDIPDFGAISENLNQSMDAGDNLLQSGIARTERPFEGMPNMPPAVGGNASDRTGPVIQTATPVGSTGTSETKVKVPATQNPQLTGFNTPAAPIHHPISRHTVTNPKLVDYGAQSLINEARSPATHNDIPPPVKANQPENTRQSGEAGHVRQNVNPRTDQPSREHFRGEEHLSQPMQETSTPQPCQITGGRVDAKMKRLFGDHFNWLSNVEQAQERCNPRSPAGSGKAPSKPTSKDCSDIKGPARIGKTVTKHANGGSTTVCNFSNLSGLMIGDHNTMKFYNNGCWESSTPPPGMGKLKKKKLKVPARMINEIDMQLVGKELGSEWKALARKFGFTDGAIDAIDHDYNRDGLKEMIYQMLNQWREKEQERASVKRLVQALIDIQKGQVGMKLATEVSEQQI